MNPRMNVLIVHCHDLGQHLGCYGVESVSSPNLDAFATAGVRFVNSFCTAPSCSPSRAALFTGRYPHNNGVMGLCHSNFAWDLNADEKHLAQILHSAGYETAAFGTVHETRSGPARAGYEHFDQHTDAVTATDNAIAFLQHRGSDQPFYMSVGYFEPHRIAPADNPGGDCDFFGTHLQPDRSRGVMIPGYLRDTAGTRQELAELQGAVRHADAQFGRLLKAVDERNTIVIFTSDHGIAMPRAKCSLYDPGIAVALLVRGPGWKGICDGLVSNIDVVPTILEALELPIPTNIQGRSFGPSLTGQPAATRPEIFAEMTYHDYYDPRRCIRTATHKLIANFTTAYSFMDPSQSWRPRSDPIVPQNHALAYHDPIELYDLRQDLWEHTNLANRPEHAGVRHELLHRLRRHLIETSDPILQGAVSNPQHRQTLMEINAAD